MKKPGLPRRLFTLALLSLCTAGVAAQDLLPPLNDPPSAERLPGKFVWFDLASPNPEQQMAFYRAVFGWTYHEPAPTRDGYALILNGGQAVGGIFGFEPPEGQQDGAVWIALMSVTDVDAAVRAVQANGGRVELAPAEVARRGRHALFRDPAGAVFGALRSATGDPPDQQVPIGGFLWVDLFAREPEKMTRFYSALAPYAVELRALTEDISRTLLSAHGMPRAGIVPVDEEANRSSWVPYVRVADVQATLDKVVEEGGFAIVAPDPSILDGKVAVFVDPNGAVTGIVQWEYEAEDES